MKGKNTQEKADLVAYLQEILAAAEKNLCKMPCYAKALKVIHHA